MLDNTRLRIAMQKSGRLSDDSRELLARCGIKINHHTQRLIAMAENMPIDILRVRDDDIPGLVMDGVVDLGIIGENVLEEELLSRRAQGEDPRYFTLRRLDFGGCRLSLATPLDTEYTGPKSLQNARIDTSYPHLLKQYLDRLMLKSIALLSLGSFGTLGRLHHQRIRLTTTVPAILSCQPCFLLSKAIQIKPRHSTKAEMV